MGNLIRVPQNFAVSFGYQNIKNVAQALGEELILLKMYHVNTDRETQPRCAICYDDVYKQGNSANCAYCYGTTFQGGVKEAWRVWGIVGDDDQETNIEKTGIWQNETHEVQTEPHPQLEQHDYMIRVKDWDQNKQAPLTIGSYYRVGKVTPVTIRTGARFGQTNTDRIAQKFTCQVLPTSHVIYKYDVKTEITFPRYDGQPR